MNTAAFALLTGLSAATAVAAQPAAPSPAPGVSSPAPANAAPAPANAAPLPVPSRIDQTGSAPDGPQSYSDLAWDSRIRASVAAAQGLQGPLDGRWTLYDSEGKGLFTFQLVDPAGGRGPLEGVWRDLRRAPGSLAYGVVGSLFRSGAALTAVFASGSGVSLSLQMLTGGGWAGEMTENGVKTRVTLVRK